MKLALGRDSWSQSEGYTFFIGAFDGCCVHHESHLYVKEVEKVLGSY